MVPTRELDLRWIRHEIFAQSKDRLYYCSCCDPRFYLDSNLFRRQISLSFLLFNQPFDRSIRPARGRWYLTNIMKTLIALSVVGLDKSNAAFSENFGDGFAGDDTGG